MTITLSLSRKSSLILLCAGLALMVATTDQAADQPGNKHPEDGVAKDGGHAANVRAPISEVLHCPLAFAGVHLQKDEPTNAQVAYHFCKPLSGDLSQCLLYDGTGPNARLIGVEYLVSDAVYRKMPEAEKAYWHDHKYEVDARLIRSLTQTGDEETKTLAAVRTLWGKVYHTWAAGADYPQGPAKLFWSVTGEKPLVLPADVKLPPQLKAAAKPEAGN